MRFAFYLNGKLDLWIICLLSIPDAAFLFYVYDTVNNLAFDSSVTQKNVSQAAKTDFEALENPRRCYSKWPLYRHLNYFCRVLRTVFRHYTLTTLSVGIRNWTTLPELKQYSQYPHWFSVLVCQCGSLFLLSLCLLG